MVIPLSLVANESTSLPLKNGPFHVHVMIPFSLLVKDSDPNTTPDPQCARLRLWWWWTTLLFGVRWETLTDPMEEAFFLGSLIFSRIWGKMKVLLFGKHEAVTEKYHYINSNIKNWEHAGASNLSDVFHRDHR